MPHRVTDFLRASTDSITAFKSVVRARHSQAPDFRSSYTRSINLSSDGEDAMFAKMHEMELSRPTRPKHHHHKLSFPFGKGHRDSRDNSAATLDWNIESPPILFHDDAEHSSGALFSGQLLLEVKEESLELDMFEASLKVHVVHKKPFQAHCVDCTNQFTELRHWTFLNHPRTLPRGTHQFPFSILLEGHLPASMDTPVMSIAYEFNAEAIIARNPTSSCTSITPIHFERTVEVKRSLPDSDLPHHSVRVFPPTNIKAGAHYCQVIHPTGQSKASVRLDGLVTRKGESNTMDFWKLKKITWRLEETIRTVAPACDKHAPAGTPANGTRKGIERTEKRTIGSHSLTNGWKADYTSNDGHVEYEFDFGLARHRHGELRFATDTKSRDGTQVTHNLLVELVVSREWAPAARPELCSQTGMGRILRMHYKVILTEQPGGGVSWDVESPPIYQDVPPSPPAYADEEDLADYASLESLDAERNSVEGGR